MGICEERVVVVTGAGRGLGRSHALAFASEGARVLVNDLGVSRDGEMESLVPAEEVVAEIRELGGEAVADHSDVADWNQAEQMVVRAIDHWGRLDTLVCNAGFLRDRMLATMDEEDWDSIIRVHLKGHFAPARHAVSHWRARAKAGEDVKGRVVMTSSGAGLLGSIGQGNYAVAKAGIALLVVQSASEWSHYGVLVNGVAPDARTRMTEGTIYDSEVPVGWDEKDPANVSPLVVWLGSRDCDVSGRIFEVGGGRLSVCEGWQHGPEVGVGRRRFEVEEIARAVHTSVEAAPPLPPIYGLEV